MTVETFIETFIDIIENNEFRLLYQKTETTLKAKDVGNLTQTLYKAGIDPLAHDVIIFGNFMYSQDIDKFDIPENIREIWDCAFENTALTTLYIPATVNYIGDYAFRNTYLNKLVIEERTSDLFIAHSAFHDNEIDYIDFKGTSENWKQFVTAHNAFDKDVLVMCQGGKSIIPTEES